MSSHHGDDRHDRRPERADSRRPRRRSATCRRTGAAGPPGALGRRTVRARAWRATRRSSHGSCGVGDERLQAPLAEGVEGDGRQPVGGEDRGLRAQRRAPGQQSPRADRAEDQRVPAAGSGGPPRRRGRAPCPAPRGRAPRPGATAGSPEARRPPPRPPLREQCTDGVAGVDELPHRGQRAQPHRAGRPTASSRGTTTATMTARREYSLTVVASRMRSRPALVATTSRFSVLVAPIRARMRLLPLRCSPLQSLSAVRRKRPATLPGPADLERDGSAPTTQVAMMSTAARPRPSTSDVDQLGDRGERWPRGRSATARRPPWLARVMRAWWRSSSRSRASVGRRRLEVGAGGRPAPGGRTAPRPRPAGPSSTGRCPRRSTPIASLKPPMVSNRSARTSMQASDTANTARELSCWDWSSSPGSTSCRRRPEAVHRQADGQQLLGPSQSTQLRPDHAGVGPEGLGDQLGDGVGGEADVVVAATGRTATPRPRPRPR